MLMVTQAAGFCQQCTAACCLLRQVGENAQGTHLWSDRYSLLRNVTRSRLSLRTCRVTSGPLASSMTNLWDVWVVA